MTDSVDRFSRAIAAIVSKRAAQCCSNPECGAVTSGPSLEPEKSVVVGEAAHIFGAKPAAARYDPEMALAERHASTNAIWLCRNCHKAIDADEQRFPASLLFKWREMHERSVNEKMGKANESLRRDIVDRQLEGMRNISPLARQILIDRDMAWEYRFAAELLRAKCRPTLSRWDALKKRLYGKPVQRIADEGALFWFSDRMAELPSYTEAIVVICNTEFASAWGAPGQPGSPKQIELLCELFAENCKCLLEWEESVRFAKLPDEFDEMYDLLVGVGGRILDQVSCVPTEMSRIFSQKDVRGDHHINFVIDVPAGWEQSFKAAAVQVEARLGARIRS